MQPNISFSIFSFFFFQGGGGGRGRVGWVVNESQLNTNSVYKIYMVQGLLTEK